MADKTRKQNYDKTMYGLWSPYTEQFLWDICEGTKNDVYKEARLKKGIPTGRLKQLEYEVREIDLHDI